ncbi:MAG: class I SAM-dependent methyltransferase [Gammaproteobacteria bacterium]|nr:class I SAM-dependent methyltransferase [Gammaproteobacteria bacterium]
MNPAALLRRLIREPAIRARAVNLPRQVHGLASEMGIPVRRLWLDLYATVRAEGLVHPDECLMLMRFAAQSTGPIVEIGSYRGRSTIALARGSRHGAGNLVFAIDPHAAFTGVLGKTFGPADRVAFMRNLLRAKVAEQVSLVNLDSRAAARGWDASIGLLFIDGDHAYPRVRADFDAWSPFLTEQSMVCLDDSTVPGVGPEQLVDELLESGWRELQRTGKITALQPAAA